VLKWPIVTYDPNPLPPHTKRRGLLDALNIGLISANNYDRDKHTVCLESAY